MGHKAEKKTRTVVSDPEKGIDVQDFLAYKAEKYDSGKKELQFDVSETPPDFCWRMVYNKKELIVLLECDGVTSSMYDIFCGTYEECLAEADRLGLKMDKWEQKTQRMEKKAA
jgi:hypothetical protein